MSYVRLLRLPPQVQGQCFPVQTRSRGWVYGGVSGHLREYSRTSNIHSIRFDGRCSSTTNSTASSSKPRSTEKYGCFSRRSRIHVQQCDSKNVFHPSTPSASPPGRAESWRGGPMGLDPCVKINVSQSQLQFKRELHYHHAISSFSKLLFVHGVPDINVDWRNWRARGRRNAQETYLRGFAASSPPDQQETSNSQNHQNGQIALSNQKVYQGGLLKPTDVSINSVVADASLS